MRQQPVRRSSLFLLEFMIALFFFILTGTICIQIFVKAHTVSQAAENLNIAVHQTASYAEQFRAGVDFPEYSCAYYDQDWNPCEKEQMHYCLTICTAWDGGKETASFDMTETGSKESLYSLSLTIYKPKGGTTP